MPNLITQYTNGTFEGALGTWGAEFGFGSTAQIQDPTQFYEGANSVRLTTDLLNNDDFTNGGAQFILCRFPAVQGEPYEITARIKVNASVPDDTIFYIDPFQPDFTKESKGYTIPVRASTAKDGWIELRANFYANTIGGEAAFYISCLFDSAEFQDAVENFDEGYTEFYNLLLGYTISTPVPAGAYVWIDAMYSDLKAIPAIPSLQFQGRKLYYIRNVFYIEVDGTRVVVDEPIKWDDVKIQVIFDSKTKMYRFEFSDKDVLLEFDNAAGREILRNLKKTKGVQASAQLIFGEFNTITEELTILYRGDINFEESEDTNTTFKANIERQSLGETLRTYFDKRVNLFSEKSLAGRELSALSMKELFLHPRLLSYTANAVYNTNIPVNQSFDPQDYSPAIGDDGIVYTVIPPYTTVPRKPNPCEEGSSNASNNIEGFTDPSPPDGPLIYAGATLPPGITKRRFYIEIAGSFKYTKTGSPQQPISGIGVTKVSNITGGGSPEGVPIGQAAIDAGAQVGFAVENGILAGTYNVVGSGSGVIELEADEALFVRATVYNPVEGSPAVVYSAFEWTNVSTFYLRIRELTVFAPSLVTAPFIFEAFDRNLEIVTNKVGLLKSNFLGRTDIGYSSNGCGHNHFAMDGKMLRRFCNKPFNLSTKDIYNSLDGIFCAGMSVERDDDDVESVRFEELPYFFRNTLLMDLKVISNYKKKPATQYLYNALKFYFQKYPQDNQQDSIEDFHTSMEYLTPLNKIKNDLDVQIDAILSGYYIEYTRREGFNVNPTNAYETDNNLFYIAAREAEITAEEVDIIFDEETNTITIMKLLPIVAGDRVFINNTTGPIGAGTYTVGESSVPFSYDRVILTIVDTLTDTGEGTGDVTIINNVDEPVERFQAERDEDFEVITGVTFPNSAYNLRHHIKRIALRWAKVFQSGWHWAFTASDPIQIFVPFLEGKNNENVRTRLKPEVSCKYGDAQRLDRQDNMSESISRFDKPLFRAEQIEYDAPLTWTSFNYIRTAFEGRNPDGRDYGYLQFPNPDGEIEKGYVISMKFDPNAQICKFVLIQKYDA